MGMFGHDHMIVTLTSKQLRKGCFEIDNKHTEDFFDIVDKPCPGEF